MRRRTINCLAGIRAVCREAIFRHSLFAQLLDREASGLEDLPRNVCYFVSPMQLHGSEIFGSADRRILLVDNYDSFTFNVVQQLARLGAARGVGVEVIRNDGCTAEAALSARPAALVISPGPGGPGDAGISEALLQHAPVALPVLGVCLGHQLIAHHFGAHVQPSGAPVHGRTSRVFHQGGGLFATVPNPLRVARYHSLVVDAQTLPAELRVAAQTDDGTVMALQHTRRPLWGVQFHPESFLTEYGDQIIENFLHLALDEKERG